MTWLTIGLLLIPPLGGALVAARLRLGDEKITTLLIGALAGIVSVTSLLYALSLSGLPLSPLLLLVLAVTALVGVTCARPGWREWRQLPIDRVAIVIFGLSLLWSFVLAQRLLNVTADGIGTQILNAWGDIGWHMANITKFAVGQTVPPTNPIMADTRLTYPFLINFYSGALLHSGGSYITAYTAPVILLLPLFLTLLYRFTAIVTKSRRAALVALILFLGSGSTLGWLNLITDWSQQSGSLGHFLLHLPRDYGGSGANPQGYNFLNIILAGLLPQRSLLLGLPLALTIILLLTTVRNDTSPARAIAAGILAGLLPLTHAHTAVALAPLVVMLIVRDSGKNNQHADTTPGMHNRWLLFILVALSFGIPELLYYFRGTASEGSFARIAPGWTAGEQNIFVFWFKNTGFLIPLLGAGLLLPLLRKQRWHVPSITWYVGLAGAVLFLISNIFAFGPWAWDTYKILLYWFIFSLPLWGWLAVRCLNQQRILVTTAVLGLIAMHTVTGGIDLTKTSLPTALTWGEWDTEAIAFAEEVKAAIPHDAVVLTAPYHNNPIALTGRSVYLGFSGHVWSHGGNPFTREAAIGPFYAGQLAELPEMTSDFVVVGPVERQQYPNIVIRPSWQPVLSMGAITLYQIP